MRIFLDAGHNHEGSDTGASGCGLKEQDVTFGIAEKLKSIFISGGHSVKMSRNTISENVGNSLAESINLRYTMANMWSADLFISIHCNAGGGMGAETLVYKNEGKAFEYAKKIQSAIVRNLSLSDRGVKVRTDLGVLKHTNMPAVLIETAFIDNAQDAYKLKQRQADFAKAIYEGVTGNMAQSAELTETNDIVWELSQRGILSDKETWLKKLNEDSNSYWLARKAVQFMRERGI